MGPAMCFEKIILIGHEKKGLKGTMRSETSEAAEASGGGVRILGWSSKWNWGEEWGLILGEVLEACASGVHIRTWVSVCSHPSLYLFLPSTAFLCPISAGSWGMFRSTVHKPGINAREQRHC